MKAGEVQLWEAVFGGDANSEDLPEEAKVAMRLALRTLSPREEKVLRQRFGIDCEAESRQAIGRRLKSHVTGRGITAVRVDQIEKKAIRKLRHRSRARMLIPDAIKLGLDTKGYLTSLIEP